MACMWLQDAQDTLSGLLGAQVVIDPKLLRAAQGLSPRAFLLRMLGNLKQVYLSRNNVEQALQIVR